MTIGMRVSSYMSPRRQMVMRERVICDHAQCDRPATHRVNWNGRDMKVCQACGQDIAGFGSIMFRFSGPLRELTDAEMYLPSDVEVAADALVAFFQQGGIDATREEAIGGTQRWVTVFEQFGDPEQSLMTYHRLWTALAKAIIQENAQHSES